MSPSESRRAPGPPRADRPAQANRRSAACLLRTRTPKCSSTDRAASRSVSFCQAKSSSAAATFAPRLVKRMLQKPPSLDGALQHRSNVHRVSSPGQVWKNYSDSCGRLKRPPTRVPIVAARSSRGSARALAEAPAKRALPKSAKAFILARTPITHRAAGRWRVVDVVRGQ